MSQVVIDNPVINSPFEESRRHFRFDDDGITTSGIVSRFHQAIEPQQHNLTIRVNKYSTPT